MPDPTEQPKQEQKGGKKPYKLTGNAPKTKKTRASKRAFLVELKKGEGVLARAYRAIGVDPATVFRWLDNDPDFNAQVQTIRQLQASSAEEQLRLIRKNGEAHRGQLVACIFTLKCLGKNLGWLEQPGIVIDQRRQEVYGLPTDVLRKVIRMAERKGRIGQGQVTECTLPPPTEQKAQVIDVESTPVEDNRGLPSHSDVSGDVSEDSKA